MGKFDVRDLLGKADDKALDEEANRARQLAEWLGNTAAVNAAMNEVQFGPLIGLTIAWCARGYDKQHGREVRDGFLEHIREALTAIEEGRL